MMIKVLKITVYLFVAALVGVSGLLIVRADYIPAQAEPRVEVILIEKDAPEKRFEPEPEETVKEEPEYLEMLCEQEEEFYPPYPFPLPEWYLRMEKKLEKKMNVLFSDTALSDALEFIADVTGLNIAVDPSVDTDTSIYLRLRNLPVKNILELMLCNTGLMYILKEDAVFITNRAIYDECKQILHSIENAYQGLRKERKCREFEKMLHSSQEHAFCWKGKSTREALIEVCEAWGLQLCTTNCRNYELNIEAPRKRWKGNAGQALERALANAELSYWYDVSNNNITILRPGHAKTLNLPEAIRKSAFERIKKGSLGFCPPKIKLYELVKIIEKKHPLFIIPDRNTWEKDLTVNLASENPTIGDVLKVLEEAYGISTWFSMTFKIRSVCCENAIFLFSDDDKASALCYSSGW